MPQIDRNLRSYTCLNGNYGQVKMELCLLNAIYGQRIKEWRKNAKLSQRALGSAIGVSQGYISDIEAGRSGPSREFLAALADVFGVNSAWIIEGREPVMHPGQRGFVGREHTILPPDSSRPLAGDLQFAGQDYAFVRREALSVSAGNGLMPVDGDEAETIALPTRWFARQGIAADLTVLVSVKGDSMAPGIPDGALVLLSVVDRFALRPGVYAFNLDGQSYVKRILPSQAGPDGRPQALLLVSDNQAYPPIAVSGPDMNAITWIGRVRAVLTTL